MITQLSIRMSSFLLLNKIIETEDQEVYQYSFEVLISTILSFMAMVSISILTGTVNETTLYLLGFIPLRISAGGYHARTHSRCFLILMVTYLLFVLIIKYLLAEYYVLLTFISTILSLILIWLLAPIGDKNKPLSKCETSRFKTRSRNIILFYAIIIAIITFMLDNKINGLSISLGVLSVGLSLLASIITRLKISLISYKRSGTINSTRW